MAIENTATRESLEQVRPRRHNRASTILKQTVGAAVVSAAPLFSKEDTRGRRRALGIAGALLAGGLLVGCSGGTTHAESSPSAHATHLKPTVDPTSLGPQSPSATPSSAAAENSSGNNPDNLYEPDPTDTRPFQCYGLGATKNDDGTYTISLSIQGVPQNHVYYTYVEEVSGSEDQLNLYSAIRTVVTLPQDKVDPKGNFVGIIDADKLSAGDRPDGAYKLSSEQSGNIMAFEPIYRCGTVMPDGVVNNLNY